MEKNHRIRFAVIVKCALQSHYQQRWSGFHVPDTWWAVGNKEKIPVLKTHSLDDARDLILLRKAKSYSSFIMSIIAKFISMAIAAA